MGGKPADSAKSVSSRLRGVLARNWLVLAIGAVAFVGLYIASRHNYLLFHGLAEGFSIVVACGVFMMAWNSRRLVQDDYLLFVGVAYLFVAVFDGAHTLAYTGMGVFDGSYGTNLPSQIWIAARYVESLSLLAAPLFIRRRLRLAAVLPVYLVVSVALLFSIFRGGFPACFVEVSEGGSGLTTFKVASEYVIALILVGSALALRRSRAALDTGVYRLVIGSIAVTVASEMAFTLYKDAYGVSNLVGHFLKIVSFYLIYRAVIATGLQKPYRLLFRDLKRNEQALSAARDEQEEHVRERTADLLAANEQLRLEMDEHEQAKAARRESEGRYRALLDAANDAIIVADAESGVVVEVNRRAETLLGRPAAAIVGMHQSDLHPEGEGERYRHIFEASVAFGSSITEDLFVRRPDGGTVPVSISASTLEISDRRLILGIFRDISERKELEAQLLQAQKMEAIGRLTGGIAHDFNNMMQVVTGYAHRVIRDLEPNDPKRKSVEGIKQAGERAAALTHQLLAFSRKQILHPTVMDLSGVVSSIEEMLRRTLGDNIALVTVLPPGLGRVKADRGQIEQVIMNLAINARDAMSWGGKLAIETANVELGDDYPRGAPAAPPGPYVMLAVSDTGCGMDEETRSHIFEPFFTTKEPGEGTGLGLSTAYGTIRQSGGVMRVHSEPGRGTTFKIYLPRVRGAVEPDVAEQTAGGTQEGTETILLVEDDDNVRDLVAVELRDRGYTVIEATNGAEAVLRSRLHERAVDLLVTDVILPDSNGREVYTDVLAVHSGVRALYMSGHAENHVVHRGVLDPGTCFLAKPFTDDQLAIKVREALSGTGTVAG